MDDRYEGKFLMTYTLPDLDYDYGALAPAISGEIMELHHSKHHAAYVAGANTALEKLAEARDKGDFAAVPKLEKDLAFHLGGHINHSVFWKNMSPNGGGEPTGKLLDKIIHTFGSVQELKDQFKNAGATQFGSGWAWLVLLKDGKLAIRKTPNAELPQTGGETPLLTMDVWEHAYYLDYQNKRPDYMDVFLNTLVNWQFAAENLEAAGTQKAA